MQTRKIKRPEFFTNNVNIDKTHWFYLERYEDVSIYYFKSESANELVVNTSLTNLSSQSTAGSPTTANSSSDALSTSRIRSANSIDEPSSSSTPMVINQSTSISASLFIPQKNESFNDKLKLWKCCTLVKHPALTLEKIVHRIKYER